jgi:phosphoserine phosphatase
LSSPSATVPTTCDAEAADISVAYRAKPLLRAQATFAINHCGLDAVFNLFA